MTNEKTTKLKSFTISMKKFKIKKWSMDFLYKKYYNCSEKSFYFSKKHGVLVEKNIYVKRYKEILELGMIEKYIHEELNILDISCLYKDNQSNKVKFKKSSYLKEKTLNFLEKGNELKGKGVELFDLRQVIYFQAKKKELFKKLKEEMAGKPGSEFI